MKTLKYLTFIAMILSLSSCYSLMTPAVSNAPQAMVTKNPIGSKVGKAERKIFLFFAFGDTDLSIMKAAKKGKITKIATVESKIEKKIFSTTYTTIVTGE